MGTAIDDYIRAIDQKERLWRMNVGSPYVRAYDFALMQYNKILQQQAEDDKLRAELFVLSASVLSGSLLMAAFATTSLRTAVADRALTVICNNNLNKTFNAFHFMSTNGVTSFIAGKVMDSIHDAVKKKIDSETQTLTNSTRSMVSSGTTANYQSVISDFIDKNASCLWEIAVFVDKNVPADRQAKQVRLLEQIPFFANAPTVCMINEIVLAKRMELAFYMAAILHSAYLITTKWTQATSDWAKAKIGSSPQFLSKTLIDISPSDSKYPKPYTSQAIDGRSSISREVSIDSLGSKVRDRVNTLCGELRLPKFYSHQAIGWLHYNTSQEDLRRAETVINALGEVMRPSMANPVII
jgi:hypothetical protein